MNPDALSARLDTIEQSLAEIKAALEKPEKLAYSVKEAAPLLSCGTKEVYALVDAGKIKVIRAGRKNRKIMIATFALIEFLKEYAE